jgi:hypothetical protein
MTAAKVPFFEEEGGGGALERPLKCEEDSIPFNV